MSDDLFLGETIDAESRERSGIPLGFEPAQLTTHGVIVGMTGSGKTGLGVVLLEELLRRGIPCLIIDPKGDMGNLALNFPELDAESFAPWVDAGEAARQDVTTDVLAAAKARLWTNGLASWGLGAAELKQLNDAAPVTVYTPGSGAGVPVSILGSLQAPTASWNDAAEELTDEIAGFVSGLLGLIGVDADPLSSREHILLTNLIEKSWRAGRDLDLAALIGQIQKPPMRKLGVFEVDTFFPAADRLKLAMRINGLLASSGFARWLEGPPLDIQSMLWTPEGNAKAAVVYVAHLSEQERQFVVTLLLSKLVTWMQTQPGSSDLRALVYMDEVFGFAPPTAAPPSKKPILTLLKQARAFGVGMVLSTQNPVDLDYKAMSNAGTWMIGRLQTERDKARIVEGLQSASGDVDVAHYDALMSNLGKRQFLLHSARGGGPKLFTTRWAMSYLRGPLTRDEVGRVCGEAPAIATAAGAETPAPAAAAATPAAPGSAPAASPPPAAVSLADDESMTMPKVADGVRVAYLDPAAEWAEKIGVDPDGKRLRLALAARVHLKFDETKAGLDHDEVWEAIFYPLDDRFDPEAGHTVDYDDRDFEKDAPEGARYVIPEARVDTKTFFRSAAPTLRDHLYREKSVTLWVNKTLKQYSRIGESEEDFADRCLRAAEDKADVAKAKLHDKAERKLKTLQRAIDTAERQIAKAEADASAQKRHEVVSGVGSLLGVLFGGSKKSMAKKAASSMGGVSSRRSSSAKAGARITQTAQKLEDKLAEVEELQIATVEAVEEIDAQWADKAEEIEEFEVGLEKGDIDVDEIVVLWIPTT